MPSFLFWWLVAGSDRKGQPLVGTYLLWSALERGDTEGVERALRPGLGGARKPALVNGLLPGGSTVLREAILRSDTKTAVHLIHRGAGVHDQRPIGDAAELGLIEVVTALLEKGVDASSGVTGAAKSGQKEVIDLLVRHGADVQASEKRHPLNVAASYGHLGIVETLLSAGADVNAATTASGEYPPPGTTALMCAAGNGHGAVVSRLIEAGANVNAATEGGDTPLHHAGLRPGIVRELLASGANVNAKNEAGKTALFIAASVSDERGLEVVRTLIEAGADAATRSSAGESAYACAAGGSSSGIAAAIEAAGGRPKVRRGPMDVPYCSERCMERGTRNASAIYIGIPLCGVCGKSTGAKGEAYGNYTKVPYDKKSVIIVCADCAPSYRQKMNGRWSCVICGTCV